MCCLNIAHRTICASSRRLDVWFRVGELEYCVVVINLGCLGPGLLQLRWRFLGPCRIEARVCLSSRRITFSTVTSTSELLVNCRTRHFVGICRTCKASAFSSRFDSGSSVVGISSFSHSSIANSKRVYFRGIGEHNGCYRWPNLVVPPISFSPS